MKVKAPDTLGTAGRRMWNRYVGKYEFRVDELGTLEDLCATADMIHDLSEAWAEDGRPMTASGSMGQLVIHPMIGEVRAQRAAANAMRRQLKLPDDDAGHGVKPNAQREGGSTRWANAHGA